MRAQPVREYRPTSQTVTVGNAQSVPFRRPLLPAPSPQEGGVPGARESIKEDRSGSIQACIDDFVHIELDIKSPVGYELISLIGLDPDLHSIVHELKRKKLKLESHLASQVGDRVLVTSYIDNLASRRLIPRYVRADSAVDKSGFTDAVSKLIHDSARLAKSNYDASVEWRDFCVSDLGGFRNRGPVDPQGHATYRQTARGLEEHKQGGTTPYTDVRKVSTIDGDPDMALLDGKRKMRAISKHIHSDGENTIPMHVYISNSASYDRLYLDPVNKSRLVPFRAYDVEPDSAFARYNVSLKPEESVITRGGHFKDALSREKLFATKANIEQGITDATTGSITNGIVVTDVSKLRNQPLTTTVVPGGRELVMKVSTNITLTNMRTGGLIRIPAEYVVIVLETEIEKDIRAQRDHEPVPVITGVVVFIITIIPQFLPDAKLRFTGVPPNPYSDDRIAGIIQGIADSDQNVSTINALRLQVEDDICRTDGRVMLMKPRAAGLFPVTYSVEMEDVHMMSLEFKEACVRLLCVYTNNTLDAPITREQLLDWITDRSGPFVGVDEQIWHPTVSDFGLRKFSAMDVVTRWVMAHLCYLGKPGENPSSPDVLRILNPKQALLASVPACVTDKCLLVYGISAPILSLFTNGGVGVSDRNTELPGGLQRVIAGISNRRKSRTLNRYGIDMSYLCPIFCGPERIDELPMTEDGTRPLIAKRHIIVRPDGGLESWDNVLYEMGCALYKIHQERHSRQFTGDVNGVIWTPTVVVAVSVAKEGSKVGVTGYLCTGGRPSRITPSGHDPKRVVRDSDATRVHTELLTETGGMGYMKSLLEHRTLIKYQMAARAQASS